MKREQSNKVIVATPGARLALQTALALQEHQILECLLTSYYYREKGAFTRFLELFPSGASSKLLTEMKRRHLHGLSDSLIRSFPWVELPYTAATRLPGVRNYSSSLTEWRTALLRSGFKRVIRSRNPAALICCDGWAHTLFPAAEGRSMLRLLDQNTGHITSMAATLREECELHPDMVDSITPFSDTYIERCTDEALAADAIFVSSDFARSTLLDIGVPTSKIFHIPYGTDINRFRPLNEPKERKTVRFLFVGLIGQRKGVKYLLEAFKKLDLPDAELELVGPLLGSGTGLAPYREVFTHTPSIPYQKIHHVFQNADVFVMPTLHESGVLAIHEALGCGLPVITTPNAGSIVRDGEEGFIVPIRDIEALAEKIEVLAQDRELRESMSKKARARAEEYPWERYRESIGKTVGELLKGRE